MCFIRHGGCKIRHRMWCSVRLDASLHETVGIPDAQRLELEARRVCVRAQYFVAAGGPRHCGAYSEGDDGGVVAQIEVPCRMLQLHCEDEGYVAYAPPGFKADVQVLPSLSCWKPAAASASVHVLTTVKGQVAALMNSRKLSAKARAAGATRAAMGYVAGVCTEAATGMFLQAERIQRNAE